MVDKPDGGQSGRATGRAGREPHSGEGAASAMREMRHRDLGAAREDRPTAREAAAWEVNQDSSVRLFRAWAAKHKHLIELEDGVAGKCERADAGRLSQVREEADRLREAALAAFQRELEDRGLRRPVGEDLEDPV